ncbi:hypothetical protein CWI42_040540 [Ordospora colligata]|uniref:J domain-containing protein n=1 Tax=Ordospora colligata OC4 TaxID=1354746 RepID=A0A0B2UFL0_9MICR|nr:uncharacterized protein M896_040540 [Ordospora colligata OC4]KHN69861.1 hypothetical protein M896_040540 [Ordospora colligata OC4]TBU16031.1 hypothetical protein CWI41_040540 [Ordospora colligata]TBU16244.1 hypothetical protein CWI40_040540 [Ordospora colligata]TBU18948.1 hypothetical protein CWI42_040540 [Ordospora colligata]
MGWLVMQKAMVALVFGLVAAIRDLGVEVSKIENAVRSGKVSEAKVMFDELMSEFGGNDVLEKKHVDLLMQSGDYKTVVSRYGQNSKMLTDVVKAERNQSILNSNNVKLIASLINEAPYSIDVLKAYIKMCLIEEKFQEVRKFVKKASVLFPEDVELKSLQMQLFFLTRMPAAGIHMMREIGNADMSRKIERLFDEYTRIIDGNMTSKVTYVQMKELLKRIEEAEFSINFFPSIFMQLKLDVLFGMCKNGIEDDFINFVSGEFDVSKGKPVGISLKPLSARIETLQKKRGDDEVMYLYVISQALEGNIDQAEAICRSHTFKYGPMKREAMRKVASIKSKIEDAKAKKERERSQRERQRSRHMSQGNQNDILGYYKALGLNPGPKTTDVEIKRAYKKMVVNGMKNKGEAEKKKWEDTHKVINKALGVLTNKEKREMYDRGIDPDNPQRLNGSGHFGEDIFNEFFKKGFGNFEFFEFSPNGGRRGNTRTTYFYF